MHSHDRTLLSKLGFADPDKKDPKHDWACQYLCQAEVAEKLLNLLPFPELSDAQKATWSFMKFSELHFRPEVPISKGADQYKTTIGFLDVLVTGCRIFISRPFRQLASLMKKLKEVGGHVARDVNSGSNRMNRWQICGGGHDLQPKIDHMASQLDAIYRYHPSRYSEPIPSDDFTWIDSCSFCVFVEVKIAPTLTGDILRQMQLYGEYRNCWWQKSGPVLPLVVTAFPLQADDEEMLKAEGIHHAKFGNAFESYCARRRSAPASTAVNAEL